MSGLVLPSILCAAGADAPIRIGSRLEPLVDDVLIDRKDDTVRLELHRPERREIVLRTDEPWGGNASAFQSVFKDNGLYRMYYRGGQYCNSGEPAQAMRPHPWVLCYAESEDGIHWRKPELGIIEYDGSAANNIVADTALLAPVGGCAAHTAVFKDANPDCPADQQYKLITVGRKPDRGLYVFASPDGLRFRQLSTEPAVSKGAFDSQNLMFWDPVNNVYREYHRAFNEHGRDIMTASSQDILHFPDPEWLQYTGTPPQELYTNQIQPYYRAPHILMGFPMRYTDRHWSGPMVDLPNIDERMARARHSRRYGTAITDALFMTSRDGRTFHRWPEAFIRPGPSRKDTWVYGNNFVFWGMVETESHLAQSPPEISLYATEGYWEGTYTSVRRYTLRVDGFVSARAPFDGGELITKPIIFEGGNLMLNVSSSGAGSVRVEIQDIEGRPFEGYALEDCPDIFGDSIRYTVRWERKGGDVRPLAGKPVRLRFQLRDADLYSFQFASYVPDPAPPDLAAPT